MAIPLGQEPNSATLDGDAHDQQCLQAIARGDSSAFEALYRRYAGKVLGMLRKHCHDLGLADELLQDVFLSIWSKSALFDPNRGNAGQWIWGIARHRLTDHWRRLGRLGEVMGLEIDDFAGGEMPVSQDQQMTLKQAMATLSEGERVLVDKVYYQGFTLQAVAAEEGTPLGTVKWRMSGALKAMKKFLHGSGGAAS